MTAMLVRHCSEFRQPAAIMKRRSRCNFVIASAAAACALLVCNAAAQDGCKLTAIGTANVAAVRDGRTLLLDDGRELRLAAIEVTDDSRAALQRLAAGHPLRLERLGAERDRYGRLVAFAFAGDAQQSVQQAMLEQGRARVSARVGDKACADGLLSAERAARVAGRGLWADPNFAPLSAENLTRLQAGRGQFALVEGKVLSVRESGATIYVNFGRRWTRDFTVTILQRLQRDICCGRCRAKKARRPPHPGTRMDRAARRPDHRGRGARADRIGRLNDCEQSGHGCDTDNGEPGARRRDRACLCCWRAAPARRTTARSRCRCRRPPRSPSCSRRSSANTCASWPPMAASTRTPGCKRRSKKPWTGWWRRPSGRT